MNNGIGKSGLPDLRYSHSIWNVYLPYDIDRAEYVENCFKTGTVTLINDNSETKNRVKIGKLALQMVDFPLDESKLGSEVLCATIPYSGEIRVVDVYSTKNQYVSQKENQYVFQKTNGVGTAGIIIDGNGNIILSVDGSATSGILTLNVTNSDRKGRLNVNVNGDVNLINDGNITVKSSTKILLESDKILLNDSEEPILLGEKTVSLLKDILDQLSQESAGPYILRGQAKYKALIEKLEDLKSKLSFVK
jgi:hypothetical protein